MAHRNFVLHGGAPSSGIFFLSHFGLVRTAMGLLHAVYLHRCASGVALFFAVGAAHVFLGEVDIQIVLSMIGHVGVKIVLGQVAVLADPHPAVRNIRLQLKLFE